LPQALADYKATGWPVDATEVDRDHIVSDSQNAASLVQKAELAIDTIFTGPKDTYYGQTINKLRGEVRNGDYDEAKKLLPLFAKGFDLTEAALQRKSFKPPAGKEEEFYGSAVGDSDLLAAMAAIRLHDGDVSGSVKNLLDMQVLSDMVGSNEGMSAGLQSLHIRAYMGNALSRCLWIAGAQPKLLPKFDMAVQSLPESSKEDYVKTLRGATSEYISKSMSELKLTFSDLANAKNIPSQIDARAKMDRLVRECLAVATACNNSHTKAELISRLKPLTNEKHVLSFMAKDAFPTYFPFFQRHDAHLLALKALSKALLIRALTGKFPKSLSEIPGSWIDPFTGLPLKLLATENSIRISSDGPANSENGDYQESAPIAGYPRPPFKKRPIEG